MADSSVSLGFRLKRFLARPASEKLAAITRRLFPPPQRFIELPFGAKWLTIDSAIDGQLVAGSFERAELMFVSRFLRAGMTVLDVGAHHGLYTLLASMKVGAAGRVVAFEPSPREQKHLSGNVKLNRCKNVRIAPVAVGSSRGRANLFLVEGDEDYCNSLRPPAVKARTVAVSVAVETLDDYLRGIGISRVDFIKLDVEGAELEALRGASKVLTTKPRPVVMCETAEIRTAPWGYSAREIVQNLESLEYDWFSIMPDGDLSRTAQDANLQDTNLVAIPCERVKETISTLESR
jgi:FkbM family methyltransferase